MTFERISTVLPRVLADLECDPDVERILSEAAMARRITWGQVAEALMPERDLEPAARCLDAYLRLGGDQVDLDYFRGRVRSYIEPEEDSANPERRRQEAEAALQRQPRRAAVNGSRMVTAYESLDGAPTRGRR